MNLYEVENTILFEYEEAAARLKDELDRVFPIGQVVIRDSEVSMRRESVIYAVVCGYVEGRPDLVNLLHENGNVWTKSIRGLTAVHKYPEWAGRLIDSVAKKLI